jgi:hypothetical protein
MHPPAAAASACSYLDLREGLLSAAHLLISVFLASLEEAASVGGGGRGGGGGGAPAELACSSGLGGEAATGTGGGGGALMAGFGICWFLGGTCGLGYLLAAPLLMRVRAGGCMRP